MTDGSFDIPAAVSFGDLRRAPFLAPGGARSAEVVRRFLPMTYGSALAMIPESAAAAQEVSLAAFKTLAFRAGKLSGKTIIASWLLRTVWYAAARERRRRGLPTRAETPDGLLTQKLCRSVIRLKEREAAPLILSCFLNEPSERIATVLPTKVARVEKRQRKAIARVSKSIKKVAARAGRGSSATGLLRAIPLAPPTEVDAFIVEKIAVWTPKTEKDALVQAIISGWRWLAIGRVVKRAAIGFATVVIVLVTFVATMAYLIQTGHINMARLFMGGMQAGLIKEFPGLAEPARPWPALTHAPRDAAELYGMTNIWEAKITMNRDQWKRVQPVNIPPAQGDHGEMALRNPKASRSGLAGAIGIDFRWSDGALEFAGQKFDAVGVRYRGNGTHLNSLYGPKQSFKVDIDRVKKGQSIAGVTKLNFINSIPDFSYLKDALSEKIFRELGAVAPRTGYAYLTIEVPGEFSNRPLGLYVLVENIDSQFAKDRFGTKAVPIFKPVTRHLFEDSGKAWSSYRDVYDLKTKATPEQLARLVAFAQIVAHASDEEFAEKLPGYLDLEEYAAFVAGHVLLSSYDGYLTNGQNFYMYLDPRSNKFGFIPWDQDHGFGEFGYVDTAEHRENASIWKPAAYDNRFLNRVLQVESFKKVYRRKLEEALAGPFTVERMNREVDALAAVVRPAIAAESKFRLERFEITVSTNWVSGPRDGHGQATMEGPRAPAHQLKRFILARTQSVRDQLDGKSEGFRVGRFGH